MDSTDRTDVAIALGLTLLVQSEVFTSDVDHKVAASLVSLAITLPLVLRRRAPLVAVAINTAGLVALRWLDMGQEPQTVLLAMFAAAFSVGAHAERPLAVVGGLLVWTGILLQEPGDFLVLGPASAGAWGLGVALRGYRLQAVRLRELADVLERERAEHARLAIAEERTRIGRELHDVVAHSVSVIVVQAGAERLALSGARPQTAQVLAGIERSGRQALAEMRRLVDMLRLPGAAPELNPLPSLEHLDTLAERMREAGLPVDVRREGRPVELAPGVDVTAFRIAQEALTNTLKHAGPAKAQVVVRYRPSMIELEISDDGAGTVAENGGGHGHVGMRERVALYGGSVQTGRLPDGGYRVLARLPIEPVSP